LFIFGTTLFLGTIYWLAHVSLGGMLALCIMLGAEFALLGLVVPDPQRSWSLLTIPALWIGLERLRGIIFGGFGWGIIGYTQYLNLPFIQIADRLGVWGVSFIIVLGNLALAQLIRNRKQLQWRTASVCILLPLSCVSGAYAYGFFRLQQHFTGPDITVSVVQGNIPQENKWNTRYVETILEKFSRLSRETAAASPELVVWPETSVPGYLLDEPRLYPAVTGLAQNLKTYLLVGSPREDYFTRSYYNSAFLFGPRGELLQMHDKIHLVPFGEYIPYGNLFWFLKNSPIADFSAGKRHTVFRLRSRDGREIRFGVLICFEDAFPGLVRQFRRNGADFLITITNEAWFRHSDEPMQHVGISVFRAIENRCWFVRCANTGISGFIDPRAGFAIS
jgi:apolipoprotein N-acyltransferase